MKHQKKAVKKAVAIKKLTKKPDDPVNIDWWCASSEAALGQLEIAQAQNVSTEKLNIAWRAEVREIRRLTAPWPRILAAQIAAITDPTLLLWADLPRIPSSPRKFLGPEEIKRLLAGPPEKCPWGPGAVPGISRRASIGAGIEIRSDGAWWGWDSATGAPKERDENDPMLTPLFEQLHRDMRNNKVTLALAKALAPEKPAPPQPKPVTSIAARKEYRKAAARLKRYRLKVRRGEFQNAPAALEKIQESSKQFWRYWKNVLGAQVESVAGKKKEALKLTEHLRRESLVQLEDLFNPKKKASQRPPAKKKTSAKKRSPSKKRSRTKKK